MIFESDPATIACAGCVEQFVPTLEEYDGPEGKYYCPECKAMPCHTCGEPCGDDLVDRGEHWYCSRKHAPAVESDFTGRGPCMVCGARAKCFGSECWDCHRDRLDVRGAA